MPGALPVSQQLRKPPTGLFFGCFVVKQIITPNLKSHVARNQPMSNTSARVRLRALEALPHVHQRRGLVFHAESRPFATGVFGSKAHPTFPSFTCPKDLEIKGKPAEILTMQQKQQGNTKTSKVQPCCEIYFHQPVQLCCLGRFWEVLQRRSPS